MASLVSAWVDRVSGWVKVQFPYDPGTVAAMKVPGSRWDKEQRCWLVPVDAWDGVISRRVKSMTHRVVERNGVIPEEIKTRLRPYQVECAEFLVKRGGALATMDPRTGKTPTGIGALAGLFATGAIQRALVTYPAGVRGEWERQLKQWAGIELVPLEGLSELHPKEVTRLRGLPYLVVGCHYEILGARGEIKDEILSGDLAEIFTGDPFAWIGDEIHQCKNRKSKRFKVLEGVVKLPNCVARYGLTGTPMRNYPRDLWAVLHLINPDGQGWYWPWAKRYCDAVKDEWGWKDGGVSNADELGARLAAISYRKTRADVASWLPKSDRKVIACAVPAQLLKRYRKLEKHFATELKGALEDGGGREGRDVLKQLCAATSEAKIPTAIERIVEHTQRGVKVIAFGHFHESVKGLNDEIEKRRNSAEADAGDSGDTGFPPVFCAGGWLDPKKRREIIDQWKACEGAAVLLANSIASGTGIDLADAEVAVFLELEWVPADFRQAEDRIQDVHLGKRKSPPIYEYLIVRDTVDEAMAGAILKKVRGIEAVVGADAETSGVATTLRGSGVVGASRLGLAATDDDTVAAALESMRDRWLSDDEESSDEIATEALAATFSDVWDDEDNNSAGNRSSESDDSSAY